MAKVKSISGIKYMAVTHVLVMLKWIPTGDYATHCTPYQKAIKRFRRELTHAYFEASWIFVQQCSPEFLLILKYIPPWNLIFRVKEKVCCCYQHSFSGLLSPRKSNSTEVTMLLLGSNQFLYYCKLLSCKCYSKFL